MVKNFTQGVEGFVTILDYYRNKKYPTIKTNLLVRMFDLYQDGYFHNCILAEDIGEDEGGHHWHIYFRLKNKMKLNSLRNTLLPECPDRVHVTQVISLKDTFKYLDDKKDMGLIWDEWGTRKSCQKGERVDLIKAAEIIKKYYSWDELLKDKDLYTVRSRYRNWVKEQFNLNFSKPNIDLNIKLRPWQSKLDSIVKDPCTDDRTIHWYCDEEGGAGKSTMTKYLICKYNAQQLSGGFKDIAYEWDRRPIAIFDLPKNFDKSLFPYGAMEALKNGFISSSKYESCTKFFPVPHVIVFSNEMPNEGKFSNGRVRIHKLNKLKKKDDTVPKPVPELLEKNHSDLYDVDNDIVISEK